LSDCLTSSDSDQAEAVSEKQIKGLLKEHDGLEVLKYRNNLASFCQNALDVRGVKILSNPLSSPVLGVAFTH